MRVDVPDLELIVAVADSGGLTKAADRLHLTQSALSHRLRKLERRLAVPLFLRVNRRLVMTEAGERLLATGRRVLADLVTVERELRAGQHAAGTGSIRLVTECYTCYHWLPPLLASFRRDWPRVEVGIVADATAAPLAALLEGSVDVAVVHRHREHERVRYQPLFEDELVAVVPPRHEWTERDFVDAEDFAGEHLILYSTARGDSTVLNEFLRPHGIEPRRLTRIQLTEAIVELVKADLGITVMARWAMAPHVMAGTLSSVRLGETGLRRRWSAAVLRDREPPDYMKDFLIALSRDAFAGTFAQRLVRSA